jgi:outer membrane protein, heavy metal efflux system
MKTLLTYVAAAALLASCASVPKGVSPITSEGIKSRTGFAIQTSNIKDAPPTPGIELSKPLTSDDAAAIALWNNPQFAADLSTLGIARGDLIDAGQLRNPRIDVLFPLGLKPFEFLLNLPLEAIWERPSRVAAFEKAYEQLANSLVQNGLTTVQNARIAHTDLVLAKRREDILKKAADLRIRIAKVNNKIRVRDGELTEAEGIASRVDSAAADESWIRAQHDTLLANYRFRLALGLVFEGKKLEVASAVAPVKAPEPLEKLIEKALKLRPDLKAAELAVTAAAKRASWESVRISQLSATLSSKGIGNNGILTGPGVSAEIPLFHRNDGRVDRADAEVEVATHQYLALKQRVAFEVSESRELLVQSQEVLFRIRENVLPLLNKTVSIAEREYKRQAASYLFVLEQTRSLVDAELRAADSEAAVLRAEATLKRAVGEG